jgi:tetratricopeptide (TPR) repeat protein
MSATPLRHAATVPPSEGPAPLFATIAAAALALALAVTLAWPQAAWPERSLAVSGLLWTGLVLALLARVRTAAAPLGAPALVAMAALAAMTAQALSQSPFAPEPALAREIAIAPFQCMLAFPAAVLLRRLEGAGVVRVALLPLAAGAVSLLALHGIYQAIGSESMPGTFRAIEAEARRTLSPDHPLHEGILHALRERRATGTIGAPNVFAGICAAGAGLALAWAAARAGAMRALGFAGAALCVAAVALSASRGGVLALGLGLAAGAALHLWTRRALPSAPPPAAAALLAVVLAVGAASAQQPSIARKDRWLGGGTVAQRIAYWQTAAAIWKEAPVAGLGPGAFECLYPKHRMPGAGETRFAHNVAMQALADGGAVALTTWAVFVAAALLPWWQALRAGAATAPDAWIAAGALALLAHSMVDYTLSTREGMILLGIVLGMAPEPGAPVSREAALRMPGAIAAVGLLLFLMVNVPSARGAALERQARESYEDPEVSRSELLAMVKAGQRIEPDRVAFAEIEARLLESAGSPDAPAAWRSAIALAPHSASLHESLGLALLAKGATDEGLAELRAAVALHPLDAAHRMTLADVLLRLGRPADAAEAMAATEGLFMTPLEQKRAALLRQRIDEATGKAPTP